MLGPAQMPCLSDEMCLEILSYLDPNDLANVMLVNTKLGAIAQDNSLWRRHVTKLRYDLPNLTDIEIPDLETERQKYFHLLTKSFQQQQTEFYALSKNSKFSKVQLDKIKLLLIKPISIKQVTENETALDELNAFLVQDSCGELKRSRSGFLVMHKTGLTRVPNELMDAMLSVNLKNIFFRDNHLYFLPAKFSQLTELEELSISENKFTHIPTVLFKLPSLTRLNVSANRISELPINLDTLSCQLDLRANLLRTLPADSPLIPDPEVVLRTQFSINGLCFGANHVFELGERLVAPFLQGHLKPLLFGFDLLSKTVPAGAIVIAASTLVVHNERKKWQASQKVSKELLPDESEIYHAGRKAKHWIPYLKSFIKPMLYSSKALMLFQAGIHDGQNNRPSRKRKLDNALAPKAKKSKR
jgi:hypothetical protein